MQRSGKEEMGRMFLSLLNETNKKKEKKNDAPDTFHRVTWGDLVFSQTERDQLP